MAEEKSKKQSTDLDQLILGTAGLAGLWGEVDLSESVDTILLALESGIKALDTAPAYSEAEAIIGLAMKQWRGERPQISTKCGRLRADSPLINRYDYTPEGIRRSVAKSLETMGLCKIDVLLLHDPVSLTSTQQAAKAIETMLLLKEEGIVEALGIGGNFPPLFQPFVMKENFQVFMGYNRYNAICTDAASEEHPFLQAQQIAIWQASPLYNGLLGNRYHWFQQEEPDWIPPEHLARSKKLSAHCKERGCDMAETALRFLQSNPAIDRVVIGAVNQKELQNSLTYWRKGHLSRNEIEIIKQFQ